MCRVVVQGTEPGDLNEGTGTGRLGDSFKKDRRGIEVVRGRYILYKFNQKDKIA